MMEHCGDPYEQQLLKVFDSHVRDDSGSLDKEGLTQLCLTLQLEEQGSELIKCLLSEKTPRATFGQFKEALLALLGNMHNEHEKASPDREVSPKFVYGSKKYGRRSRPRNSDIFADQLSPTKPGQPGEMSPNSPTTPPSSVQRSNSQCEVSNSKKRKTLKRCTSLPGHNSSPIEENYDDNTFISSLLSGQPEVCTEDMLKEAWQKLGVGENGFLNQTELTLVFDEIGLHKLTEGVLRQLSGKLNESFDHKISLQELVIALQQDETWSDLLITNGDLSPQNPNTGDFPDSRTFQYVSLGPDGNGYIKTDLLIEMWEQIGIHSPKELIHELGFNAARISIVELAEVLEKQLKGLMEGNGDFQNPQLALLQASLTLYQAEIRCFKTIIEQMHAEREKLKGDVLDANNRASLLAQEVDDNHLRMEQNTLNQVKHLEQRHSDIMREVTTQYTKDKDHFNSINQALEERINTLENETIKLKNDLITAQKYSINVEKENVLLTSKISELERDKIVLNDQITHLETENKSRSDKESQENELLIEKLAELQLENSQLKDRNDEMVSEIESLSGQVTSMRSKMGSAGSPLGMMCGSSILRTLDQSMEDEDMALMTGAKRRSECSPSKETGFFGITDGSPRLGKQRKFNQNQSEKEVHAFTSGESGFDTEVEGGDSLPGQEVLRLQAKVAFLEQILIQNSLPLPSNDHQNHQDFTSSSNVVQLKLRINDLEKVILDIKNELKKQNFFELNNKIEQILTGEVRPKCSDACIQTDSPTIHQKIEELESNNAELTAKCSELENCVELLRTEYERCEDYWQTKVDEERQLFDVEQRQNSEKLNELLVKIKEYEDQYIHSEDQMDNRLPTIEETYNLEKQFTDLEQEFEEFKARSEQDLTLKDEQILILQERLEKLTVEQRDLGVQVDPEEALFDKMKGFTSYVIENTSRFGEEMVPIPNWDFPASSLEVPSTSSSSTCLNSTPCRPKRTRKHDKNLYKKAEAKKVEATFVKNEQQDQTTLQVPVHVLQNLTKRRNFLEQRVRHLQHCIRQQQFDKEQTVQYYWQHFIVEKADLQSKLRIFQEKLEQQKRMCNDQLDKLEKTDLLVKDLFVENAYLIARVQMLEKKCHMLAQCSNSSSV